MSPMPDRILADLRSELAELQRRLDERTAERDEALQRETATAEVLQVINASPGDLGPVFDAMLDKAIRLCGATYGHFRTYDGERFPLAAVRGEPSLVEIHRQHSMLQLGPQHPIGRFLQGEDVIHITDAAAIPAYRSDPAWRDLVDTGACRSVLAVALRRDRTLLGYLNVYRREVRPFSDREIALLQNFAAQAVIAMENARLLDELRTRTDDLTESLEYQTATSDVLEVISRSTFDLQPVLDTLVATAARLCNSHSSALTIREGDVYRYVATHSAAPGLDAFLRQRTFTAGRGTTTGRVALEGKVVHIPDVMADPEYDLPEVTTIGNIRTTLSVPLLRDGAVIGTLNLAHERVEPFTDRQIELVRTFADQAVIAMENARLITETREALEQQTATAEVLQVINSSPGDLQPVFQAMLEKAMRLCGAAFGNLQTFDGEIWHNAAYKGVPAAFTEFRKNNPPPYGPGTIGGRILEGEPLIHTVDLMAEELYKSGDLNRRALVDLAGARSSLVVPLVKDQAVLGVIQIYRQHVQPFSDKQVALLQNFAAQAVIAMENARLITETREALEQQTATAEVLSVINSSPGDLTPVFDAILEKANYLCETVFGVLWTFDGTHFFPGAIHGPQAFIDAIKDKPRAPIGGGTLYRHAAGEQLVHIEDMAAETGVYETNSTRRVFVDLGGGRSALSVALSKDDRLLGAIQVYRQEVRPFTDKQVALLQNFAAQAVIAMENARLLGELRQRTGDLEKALEYQTATSDVLKVISRSTFDLQPVLDTVVKTATRLCDAEVGHLAIRRGDAYRYVATLAADPVWDSFVRSQAFTPGRGTIAGRVLLEGQVVHITDVAEDPEYGLPQAVALGGLRTTLGVPMLRESQPIGVITLSRLRVEPFTERQIDLVRTFADQAVIAMENARLLGELRERTGDLQESLEYQTATSDVLKVISRSTFDLDPVLENVVETAIRLCRAHMGSIFRLDRGVYRWAVGIGLDPIYREIEMRTPIATGGGTIVGRTALERRPVQIADAMADPLYAVKDEARLTNARTMLGVPLLREGVPIGVIAMARDRVEPFSDKEVELVRTFADQAVIAIENVRLLTETREARDGAENALRDLKSAQANLIQAEKMASLGQLTAGIAHEIKNPLNFVNNFAGLSVELLDELKETATPAMAALDADKRAEFDDTMEMLTGNLEKIAEHGRRADNIVKSMLEHSRGVTGERRAVDLNGLVEEALNLAYHGARAQDQNFNITLERDYAVALEPLELAPQEMTRVFLNLFGNGFYAATKRARENGGGSFRPTLSVATRDLGEAIEVKVRDNGTGIPAEIKDKLFQPFFTTKPTGEGTGLGLSISYDIVTQQHGGTIAVESEPGKFTELTVRLPRH